MKTNGLLRVNYRGQRVQTAGRGVGRAIYELVQRGADPDELDIRQRPKPRKPLRPDHANLFVVSASSHRGERGA